VAAGQYNDGKPICGGMPTSEELRELLKKKQSGQKIEAPRERAQRRSSVAWMRCAEACRQKAAKSTGRRDRSSPVRPLAAIFHDANPRSPNGKRESTNKRPVPNMPVSGVLATLVLVGGRV
jgi:hypothetical protein